MIDVLLITSFSPLRNFINERRPRNGRKPPKPKKIQGPQPTHPNGVVQDSNPDTFSSHSHKQSEVSIKPSTNLSAADIESNPELFRLFGNMSIPSSNSTAKTVNGHTNGHTGYGAKPEARSKTAEPVSHHQSDASDDSPVPTRAIAQTDWSSAVPPHYSQPSVSPAVAATTTTMAPVPAPSSAASTKSLPQLRSQPSRPTMNGGIGPTPSQIPSHPPKSATPSLSPSATSPRRATADISPYLSRATEVPAVSTKTLQHLQLLESVADESARLAPIIAARAAMASRGPVPNGYPQPPSSVPPQLPPPNTRDFGVLYTSTHPGLTSSAAGFHPRMPVENAPYGYPDAFQLRSRTSQAFHRPPMHNPTGSVSMNQNHLLSVINGSRGGPISPNYPMNPQFMQQHQQVQYPPPPPPMFNGGMPYPPPHGMSSAPYPPPAPVMHGYGPPPNVQAHPTGMFPPHPAANPNFPPGMDMAPPPSHNPLLALLTGRPAQAAATPAQVHQ